jgi:hypothetical protein
LLDYVRPIIQRRIFLELGSLLNRAAVLVSTPPRARATAQGIYLFSAVTSVRPSMPHSPFRHPTQARRYSITQAPVCLAVEAGSEFLLYPPRHSARPFHHIRPPCSTIPPSTSPPYHPSPCCLTTTSLSKLFLPFSRSFVPPSLLLSSSPALPSAALAWHSVLC